MRCAGSKNQAFHGCGQEVAWLMVCRGIKCWGSIKSLTMRIHGLATSGTCSAQATIIQRRSLATSLHAFLSWPKEKKCFLCTCSTVSIGIVARDLDSLALIVLAVRLSVGSWGSKWWHLMIIMAETSFSHINRFKSSWWLRTFKKYGALRARRSIVKQSIRDYSQQR